MATGKIEKVTNDSGSGYCKMPDGTMILYGVKHVATGNNRMNYSFDFADTPTVFLTSKSNATVYVNATYATYFLLNSSAETDVSWLAIGRW